MYCLVLMGRALRARPSANVSPEARAWKASWSLRRLAVVHLLPRPTMRCTVLERSIMAPMFTCCPAHAATARRHGTRRQGYECMHASVARPGKRNRVGRASVRACALNVVVCPLSDFETSWTRKRPLRTHAGAGSIAHRWPGASAQLQQREVPGTSAKRGRCGGASVRPSRCVLKLCSVQGQLRGNIHDA